MKDQGEFCLKGTYTRGAGKPLKCKPGEDRNGALCYNKCKTGYKGKGPVCWRKCPHGMKDIGVGCQKKKHDRGIGKIPPLIGAKFRAMVIIAIIVIILTSVFISQIGKPKKTTPVKSSVSAAPITTGEP